MVNVKERDLVESRKERVRAACPEATRRLYGPGGRWGPSPCPLWHGRPLVSL